MRKQIIPSSDDAFDTFQNNLMTYVVNNQGPWNLPPSDISALQASQSIWVNAWAVAKVKTTRTSGQVQAKNDARTTFEALLRPFLQMYIVINPLISNEDRVNMDIQPRDKTRTPAPVPTTTPLIDVSGGPANSKLLYFRQELDVDGSTRRGKPFGVDRVEFVYNIGTQPASPDECTKFGSSKRSPVRIYPDPVEAGKFVYVFARWVNTRDEHGPWTEMVSFNMP